MPPASSTFTDCPLTWRQREILQALGNGRTRKQIAHRLGIGLSSLHRHTYAARHRLGVTDDLQAILIAARYGWILLDGLEATDVIEIRPEHRSLLSRFDAHIRLSDIDTERDHIRDLMLDMAEPVAYPPL